MGKSKLLEKGQRFGKLTIMKLDHIKCYISPSGKRSNREYYKCKCDCGNEVISLKTDLKVGKIISCGCSHKKEENEIILKQTHAEIIIHSKKYGTKIVLIDLEDVEKCKHKRYYIAKCGNNFYTIFKQGNKQKRLHQYLLNCNGEIIDHINHNGLDNRRENLRIVTRSLNGYNLKNARSNTGYLGITYNKQNNIYQITIKKNGIEYRKNGTKTLQEAIKAKKELEFELYGETRCI